MSKYTDPTPTNWRKEEVAAFALEAREKLEFKTGMSLKSKIEELGGTILYTANQHDDIDSGSLVAESVENFTIYLSPNTSVQRDNFTLAHELAHLAMHYEDQPMRATRYVKDHGAARRAEWEANWFAAEFLMPEAEFREAWGRFSGDLRLLASHFNVSRSAVDIRAQVLQLQDS